VSAIVVSVGGRYRPGLASVVKAELATAIGLMMTAQHDLISSKTQIVGVPVTLCIGIQIKRSKAAGHHHRVVWSEHTPYQ